MKKWGIVVPVVFAAIFIGALAGFQPTGSVAGNGQKITVYKSQACGCCVSYIVELKRQGYTVETIDMADVGPIKKQYGIPAGMESCHTSVMDGYVIEGHVPMEAIAKLAAEKPALSGIALPGMPAGSPGMPGRKTGLFQIMGIKDGKTMGLFMAG